MYVILQATPELEIYVKTKNYVSDVNVKKVDMDERVNFAAQIEEIESKVTDDIIDHTELDEQDIKLDPRMPKEGRERFLRARCRVLQETDFQIYLDFH